MSIKIRATAKLLSEIAALPRGEWNPPAKGRRSGDADNNKFAKYAYAMAVAYRDGDYAPFRVAKKFFTSIDSRNSVMNHWLGQEGMKLESYSEGEHVYMRAVPMTANTTPTDPVSHLSDVVHTVRQERRSASAGVV